MNTVARIRLTEKEFLERERAAIDKSEFVDGEVFAMSGGTSRHSQIAVNAAAELRNALKGRPCRVFNSDLKVRAPFAGSIHYPDLSALCGPAEYADANEDVLLNPAIIVEVLSPSTEAYDRGKKFLCYRSIPSLADYVLVASHTRLVEHFHRQSSGAWLLTTHQNDGDILALPGVGVTLRVGDIYSGVDLS